MNVYYTVIGILLIFHLPIVFLTSKEILDYPLWKNSTKAKWLVVVWFLPIIGAKIAHKRIGLKIKGGNTSGGDAYSCGGGDNG